MRQSRVISFLAAVLVFICTATACFAGWSYESYWVYGLFYGPGKSPSKLVGDIFVGIYGNSETGQRFLHVMYTAKEPWALVETSYDFQWHRSLLPMGKGCNPKVGQFGHKAEIAFDSLDPAKNRTKFFEFVEWPDAVPTYDAPLFLAAHAVVVNTVTGKQETVWATQQCDSVSPTLFRSICGSENGSWATYFQLPALLMPPITQ